MAKRNVTTKVEDSVLKMQDLKSRAEVLASDYNEASLDANFNRVHDIEAELNKVIDEYATLSRTQCYTAVQAAEKPMVEAIKTRTYEILGKKSTTVGKDDAAVKEIEIVMQDKNIDLLDLDKRTRGGIGETREWKTGISHLDRLMSVHKLVGIGRVDIAQKKFLLNKDDSIAMEEIIADLEAGKTVTSKNKMLKALQDVLVSMVGTEVDGVEIKPISAHINQLLGGYTDWSKKKYGLTAKSINKLTNEIARTAYAIINNIRPNYEHDSMK